ncbi:hypothetical protein N7510_001931 [Penicillium lagena]|uniref:uncharacterized protein n=1 Tax=Penicillium lagena TaxID=94218 RepID=UPI0025419FA4|nr:uncharacterized protein N7510_001931 [Penicillium lagena]KAJ5625622.1 hypothetical protein N7510_001931 [Penicillium lagena]
MRADGHESSSVVGGMRVVSDSYRDDKFKMALSFVVEALQNKIKNLSHDDFKRDFPLVWTFWGILRPTSRDKLLGRLLPTIRQEVRDLFEKEEWSVPDLLAFDAVRPSDKRMGVYCIIVTGNFAYQVFPCDAYTGYSKRVGERCHVQHATCIGAGRAKKNLHHRRAGSAGAQSNFKLFAAFPPREDTAFAQLLEGLFMFLFQTRQWHREEHRLCPRATYDLAESIWPDWLVSPRWRGLYMVWSLKQGVNGSVLRGPSKCCNCSRTVERRSVVDRHCRAGTMGRRDEALFVRSPYDPSDVFGGFICQDCWRCRRDFTHLPDAKQVHFYQERAKMAADKQNGAERTCEHCWEIQNPNASDFAYVHELDKWLCVACSQHWYIFVQERDLGTKIRQEMRDAAREADARCQNGEYPLTEELDCKKYGRPLNWMDGVGFRCQHCSDYRWKHDNRDHTNPASLFSPKELERLRQLPSHICYNCSAKEGGLGVSDTWLKDKDGSDICRICWRYTRDHKGQARDPHSQLFAKAKARVDKDREKIEILYGKCQKKEGGRAQKFTVHGSLCVPLCRKYAADEIAKANKGQNVANANGDST